MSSLGKLFVAGLILFGGPVWGQSVSVNLSTPASVASGAQYTVSADATYSDWWGAGYVYVGVSKNGQWFAEHTDDSNNWANISQSTTDYGAQTVTYYVDGYYLEQTYGYEYYSASTQGGVQITETNNALFISQAFDNSPMAMGATRLMWVTYQNNGSKVWTSDGTPHRLGSQNAQDNTTWGFSRVTLDPGQSVAPGAQKSFAFNVTAPTTAGTYNLQWRMVEDGVEWFGGATPNISVTVTGDVDSDGVPSETETALGTNPDVAGQTNPAALEIKVHTPRP